MRFLYSINSWLKNKIPPSLYQKIRQSYFYILKKRQKQFSREEFKELLKKELRVKEGQDVFVHSSINQISIGFRYPEVIDILSELVGNNGTLLFPSWKNTKDYQGYARDFIFDVKKTNSDLGILPELVRRRKDAYRSLHPFNSVVAFGPNAEWYTQNHHEDIYPMGVKSPFFKLVEKKGLIIGIGIGTRYLAQVHCVEDVSIANFPFQTRTSEVLSFKVKTKDGTLLDIESLAPHKDIASRNQPAYLKKHVSKDIAKDLTIGGTRFFTAQAKELFDRMEELAKEDVTIYTGESLEKLIRK